MDLKKIQDLKNNDEMIKFIQRGYFCDKKKIELLPTQISDYHGTLVEIIKMVQLKIELKTWNKLLKKIEIKSLNKVDDINKP